MTTAAALTITLATLPPALNNLYATIGGRRVLTRAGRDWKDGAAWEVKLAAHTQGWAAAPRTPLRVTIAYTAPNVWAWDIDGRAKLILDALALGLGVDDRYVVALTQTKARGAACVRVEVTE